MATKKLPTKKKRKKKGHYQTGNHHSPKCQNQMAYRSGWELTLALEMDSDPRVLHYFYEPFHIEDLGNSRTGKKRLYYPDFLVVYVDGTRKLLEVKRADKLSNATVLKKAKAAQEWCKKNQATYEFVTEAVIKPLQKIHKLRNPPPTTTKPTRRPSTKKRQTTKKGSLSFFATKSTSKT